MTRALAMISGGLDSILAAKLIKDQGIEVIGICFKSYFFNEDNAKRMVKQIDIPLEVVDFSEEHFTMVKNPKHGWGKNINPCIDCHAMMMRHSGELLKKFDADFIITGEVLNQRPMSQNRQALNIVKRESGFSDKILRPLCALNLEATEMEKQGLVDREKLLDISGRSRKRQMELADVWGIKEYPSPAGGCKLTEPNYAIRLKEVIDRQGDATPKDISLLRYGRHFITPNGVKIVVARTGDEATAIKEMINGEETVFYPSSHMGAMAIISGECKKEDEEIACRIAARYSKATAGEEVEVKYGKFKTPFNNSLKVVALEEEKLNEFLVKSS
ncbi:MAG: tRNA 4-thiouridine(8) synthase ThiI [Clostridium sp.]